MCATEGRHEIGEIVDLRLNETQESFREEIRAWLRTNVPTERLSPPSTEEGLAQHRAWERQLFEAGFAAVHWPIEYGGRGLDPLSTAIFYDEYVAAGAPERLNRLGLGLGGPTIIDHGTDEQKKRWLDRILSCDDIWCQGFSEPSAGSDLASVRTRGELMDEGILVNGQKIWTSHSRFADWIFALVRTDPGARKHKGITFLIIDMKDPGVSLKPIRQMNHESDFSEVFFDNVLVPYENVIGEIGDGWSIAMTTLGHERGSGLNTAAHFHSLLQDAIELLPAAVLEDTSARTRIGELYEQIEAYRYMTLRTLSELSAGRPAPGVAAMGKLWWSELQVRIFELVFDYFPDFALTKDAPGKNFKRRYWLARAAHIYAGSNEIQRNIIAERVLKLPKEPNHAI